MGNFFQRLLDSLSSLFYAPLKALGYDHPVHPVLVHITIGSVTAAFLLSFIGWIFAKSVLYRSARHVINIAAIAYLFTAAVGFLDWDHNYQLAWGINIEMKLILASILGVLLLATFLTNRLVAEESKLHQLLYLLCFLSVVGLGFFGGNIVYGSGVG